MPVKLPDLHLREYFLEPDPSGAGNRAAALTGTIGLYLFAFFAWLGTAGATLGLAMMLGAMLASPAFWRVAKTDPVVWSFPVMFIYMAVRAHYASLEFPDTKDVQWEHAWDWLNLWFFFLVAWWLAGSNKRIFLVLGLALAGLYIQYLENAPWSQWERLLSGLRHGLGFGPISMGLLSAIAVLGLMAFAPRLLGRQFTRWTFYLRFVLWFVALLFGLQTLLVSQSRGAWFAFVAAALLLLSFSLYRAAKRRGITVSVIAITVAVLTVTAAVAWHNSDTVEKRLFHDSKAIAALAEHGFDINKIPPTSLGKRLYMLFFGMESIAERPLFGWGPGSDRQTVLGARQIWGQEHKRAYRITNRAGHYHNGYVDTVVRIGLWGTALLLIPALSVFGGLVRERHAMPVNLYLFLLSATIAIAVWNLGSARFVHVEYRHAMILLGGVAYAHGLWRRRETLA